ncbi:hypothetical protein EJ04DRAFT_474650, partial [Polyplosphaeria fusca]
MMPENESPPKKRKIRKGTSSCWECKRRKARCTFAGPSDAICVGCRHRGTDCRGQDCDGELYPAKKRDGRMEKIEGLVGELLERVGGEALEIGLGVANGDGDVTAMDQSVPSMTGAETTLSAALHSVLPSQELATTIFSYLKFPTCFFQQMLTRNWRELDKVTNPTVAQMAVLPPATANPVTIATKMLIIACLMQYGSPNCAEAQLCVDEEAWAAKRMELAAVAVDRVTTKDDLICSPEGLECIMLEAMYHANAGDLQRSLLAVRRTMTVAQLLGVHRSTRLTSRPVSGDEGDKFDPQYMWHRIICVDRFLCLMLGLPQGSSDLQTIPPGMYEDIALESRLEREHSAIASRILDRNEKGPFSPDCKVVDQIDCDLQKAANRLPTSWWHLPAFNDAKMDERDSFEATSRLVNQLFHFNLVNQLHLPFLLEFPLVERSTYSKEACATASREVLTRYDIFRRHYVMPYAYSAVDFFGMIAAITLMLAHLDRHWRKQSNSLAHLRLTDRALVEKMLEDVKEGSASRRRWSLRNAEILETFLKIEAQA